MCRNKTLPQLIFFHRSRQCPKGLPDLDPVNKKLAQKSNKIINNAIKIAESSVAHNVLCTWENPWTSSMWQLKKLRALTEIGHNNMVDYCVWGADYRKRTGIACFDAANPLQVTCLVCVCDLRTI